MANVRNLQWLRTRVADKINFDVTQPDQDFAGTTSEPNRLIDDALNESYANEYNEAKLEVSPEWFIQDYSFTWPASTSQLDLRTINASLTDHSILKLMDETNDSEGEEVWVRKVTHHSPIMWRNRYTLQWGTEGPGQAKTMRAIYMPEPKEMLDELDEPELIPTEHRWLLVWSACVILRDMADEAAPQRWIQHLQELRERFHLVLAQGKVQRPGGSTIRDELNLTYGLY